MNEGMFLPSKLSKGDLVEVLVLSSPDAYYNKVGFERGIEYLKKIGLDVRYRDEILGEHGYLVASAKEQAEWIMDAFKNPKNKGIFLANGGSNLNRVIQYIDFSIIREHPMFIINAIHIFYIGSCFKKFN
ncbi:MAG: LD-carboxypeptidase [Treponema sp.]|jgi:muramoyltetrapeptide carboxypeptidase|nr:LD-carboxypeptidase [Treponema sp.]